MTHRLELPPPAGPIRAPSSWLGWLADAFSTTPNRFEHVSAVWRRAEALREFGLPWLTPAMAERLELAALLHDVGRALDPGNTEPHGFAGARYVGTLGLTDIAPLVAHHSGARFEAAERGMAAQDVWSCVEPDLLAVLTFLDRTTSPNGEHVTLVRRRDDLAARYGSNSRQVRVFDLTLPQVRRAQQLLRPPSA